jgi:hypothetical protein
MPGEDGEDGGDILRVMMSYYLCRKKESLTEDL